jgi:hypothetical protein
VRNNGPTEDRQWAFNESGGHTKTQSANNNTKQISASGSIPRAVSSRNVAIDDKVGLFYLNFLMFDINISFLLCVQDGATTDRDTNASDGGDSLFSLVPKPTGGDSDSD